MICPHWQYLITLDSDLHRASRFVEISSQNFKTFSIEFARTLLFAGSKIDVVAKILCKCINPSKSYENIKEYRDTITAKFPKFPSMIIDIPQYDLHLTAWDEWSQNKNPAWWRAYNDVKHERNKYYKEANLENTLNAVAGLFVLVWYLHHEESDRKKLNKTNLLSADRYVSGTQWANTSYCKIPDELTT